MMRQMQQTTNMLLATFMKMNPDILQALPAATPTASLILGTRASGSLLSRSSSREEVAAQPTQREVGDLVPPAVVPPGVEDDMPTLSAMHLAPSEVRRPEAATVVPESSTNLEINALEIGGGSDDLGFSNAGAGSDT